jgi:hypothetical protein
MLPVQLQTEAQPALRPSMISTNVMAVRTASEHKATFVVPTPLAKNNPRPISIQGIHLATAHMMLIDPIPAETNVNSTPAGPTTNFAIPAKRKTHADPKRVSKSNKSAIGTDWGPTATRVSRCFRTSIDFDLRNPS